MPTVLVPLATGFEEIEAISMVDTVRRAGIKVIIACLNDRREVCGAHDIVVIADKKIGDINIEDIDMIALPGGWGGTKLLSEDINIQQFIKEMDKKNKYIAAICAAPFALNKAGVLKNKFTCYPSVEQQINNNGYIDDEQVVEDGNILTSRGPGTAICFGLKIIEILLDKKTKDVVKADLLATFC